MRLFLAYSVLSMVLLMNYIFFGFAHCSAHHQRIYYRTLPDETERKGTKIKQRETGIGESRVCAVIMCVRAIPCDMLPLPAAMVVKIGEGGTAGSSPPPPPPLPHLGQFLAQTEDLCDTLRMEVKSRKTDIGQ